MDLYEAIFTRRTVHNYLPESVDSAALGRILDAAHMAPNHKLTWPWRFTVVGPKTREALLPIAFALKNATAPALQARIRAKLMNPGALVVVTQVRSDDAFRSQEDYAASCCAIQNLMLAARAEGLGSKWSTGALTQHPKLCALLGIDQDAEQVIGFVWVGVPKVVPSVERPSIEQHVRTLP